MALVAVPGEKDHPINEAKKPVSLAKSQLVLFQSRKKFAFLYGLATVTGLFCLPGVFGALSSSNPDLYRANGKKRPIPSGLVSKRQAWIFVVLTFGTAAILTMITFRPISMIVVSLMLVIGISYSAPKITLMKRFIVKTSSIATFYLLCSLLGMTSAYNLDSATNNPIVVASVFLTLPLMVFISSTLNDMGDIDGDKAIGRRTI